MRDHTKLKVFQLADQIVIDTYRLTRDFPREEQYGLTSQMRRAGVSVASNIVEGCARKSQVEYLRFLEIAFSSLRELHYQTGLAFRLQFVNEKTFREMDEKMTETEKVFTGLIKALGGQGGIVSRP